ncbi:MAG: RecX family transcriptional regulator [Pseudomonadota bacterium]
MEHAAAQALRSLARSDKSTLALQEQLAARHGEDIAAQAIARLQERGWLDDEAAARRLGERWLQRDLLSPALVQQRLVDRGFPPEICRRVLLSLPVDLEAAARELAGRTVATSGQPARLARRLARAGYDEDLIQRIVSWPTESPH